MLSDNCIVLKINVAMDILWSILGNQMSNTFNNYCTVFRAGICRFHPTERPNLLWNLTMTTVTNMHITYARRVTMTHCTAFHNLVLSINHNSCSIIIRAFAQM